MLYPIQTDLRRTRGEKPFSVKDFSKKELNEHPRKDCDTYARDVWPQTLLRRSKHI